MPRFNPQHLITAQAAVEHAQSVRRLHRRTTPRGAPSREKDLQLALDRIKDAMRPIRAYLCGFQYGPQTEAAFEIRAKVESASVALQAERRKLFKMQKR